MSNKAGVKKVKGAETAGLVPRLRFPEFRGAGEWKEERIVVRDDDLKGGLLFLGLLLVIGFLLGQILLNLLYVVVAFRRR